MYNFPENEKKILKFWKDNKIFDKTLEKTKKGKRFIFFEGPPFANGLPGIHHLLARAFKDIILRYKTMQGFYVERRAGWDTHGLPTEMEAEKKLGIKTKKEIEKIGIKKFIETCKESVFTYKKEWEEFTERIGFWLDFKNAYITCSNEYIESLWWILKEIWKKGFLYQDYKVVPYCPRCGTSLSSHEVAQGYKTVEENSIYVKFPVREEKNTYLLVWTTTPWTLPGNTGIAANSNADYVKIKIKDEYLILAESRLSVLKEKYFLVEKLNWRRNLYKFSYQPPFNFISTDNKSDFRIIGTDFVSLSEGTGLVHMAPAFGEEDMEARNKYGLSVLMTVDEEGKFKSEIKDWAGMFVKDADSLIIKNLEKRGLLYGIEKYSHEYPFCWRCKSPLLYYAKNSWFIKTTAVKEEMIKNNKKINWVPAHIKDGRFGEWLGELKDWNLSRERYWGVPLPIWRCQECGDIKVVGSIEELEKNSGKKAPELHKPFIDEVEFKCDKCEGIMKRIEEVADCWFDSGSMPFAQWHYPFENKEKIDKKESFPADFISEGIDQTRGWFYTLLAVSTLLGKESPYKNVICLGLILDTEGRKMSKSRGNIIVPDEIIDKFGADCARLYFYTINQAGESKRFNLDDVQKLYRKFFDTLLQSYNFFSLYKNENFKPENKFQSKTLLDKWIVSRLENLNYKITKMLDSFDVVSAARLIIEFADDLSNWYIHYSRRRFKDQRNEETKNEALQTLYYIFSKFSRIIAPFTPFFAEELYQKLEKENKSVHLSDYPEVSKKLIDDDLEKEIRETAEKITLSLAQRAEAKIKVRQPLPKLTIKDDKFKNKKELLDLIKEAVNVKEIVFDDKIEKEVELDTEISEELKKEGIYREFLRNIKAMRKELGLTPEDEISGVYSTFSDIADRGQFLKDAGAKEFFVVKSGEEIRNVDVKKEILIEGKKEYVGLKK